MLIVSPSFGSVPERYPTNDNGEKFVEEDEDCGFAKLCCRN